MASVALRRVSSGMRRGSLFIGRLAAPGSDSGADYDGEGYVGLRDSDAVGARAHFGACLSGGLDGAVDFGGAVARDDDYVDGEH